MKIDPKDLKQTKLSQKPYEFQLIENLRKLLQSYMLKKTLIDSGNRRAILALYDKKVTKQNILKVYPHQVPSILNAIIDNQLDTLNGNSEVMFHKSKKYIY